MRLLVDGFLYHQKRGMGVYTRELVEALLKNMPEHELLVVLRENVPNIAENQKIVVGGISNQIAWEQIALRSVIWRFNPDCLLCPGNTYPLFSRIPKIVVLHDLMFLRSQGGKFSQRVGNWYRSICFQFLPKKNVELVSVSEWSARAVRLLSRRRVFLAPNSVEYIDGISNLKPGNQCMRGTKYFVHIGGITKNKNSKFVVDGFLEFAKDKDIKLCLLGDTEKGFERILGDAVRHSQIVIPGRCTDAEIVGFIRGAVASIFLSLNEGFGLPIIESAFLEVPVIVSNRPPMNRIAPRACLHVNPTNKVEYIAALESLSGNEGLRGDLSASACVYRSTYNRDRLQLGLAAALKSLSNVGGSVAK